MADGRAGVGARIGQGVIDDQTRAKRPQRDPVVPLDPSQIPADAYGTPDFSGFTQQDWNNVGRGVSADQEAQIAPPRDPLEDRFGNDLAFTDEFFDAKGPSRDEVQALGTTGDVGARDAQVGAMNKLFDLYEQGGRGAQDRNARAKARADSEGWLKGQRDADMQNLSERGMAGGGAEIATLLGDRQAAASRLSSADTQASADAEKRALDALMGGSSLAADVRAGADAYTSNNANMIAGINQTNANGRRQAWGQTMANRNAWDQNKLNQSIGVAKDQATRAQDDNQFGYTQGTDLAKTDSDRFNTGQQNFNTNATQIGRDFLSPQAAAAQARINATGGTQAAAGRSASAGGKVVMDVVGSLGGMGGGKGGGGAAAAPKEEEKVA